MRKLLLSCWGLLFLVISYAQNTTITGKITDEKDGTPIIGATVKSKGGKATVISQADGTFSIKVEPGIKVLIISFIGYLDKEVSIEGSNLSITLSQSSQSLSEVLVVGYGTKLKRDITGAIVKVGAKELNNTPVTSFESAIQGRASGVYVQQQNGKLGQGINIRIRGASSVSAGNEPLYVVDGMPVLTNDLSSNGAQTNPLSDININDIQSIEILKDASATAIFGSRGANGVVIITTKKGVNGTSKIELGYYTGFQKPTGKREFLDAKQFVDYTLRAADGAANYEYGLGYYETLEDAIADWRSYAESRLTRYSAGNEDWRDAKVNTDWQEQAFQDAPISQYDLNFSGGNEKTKFYASGQYLDQTGIMVRNSYKRYNGRVNIDHKVKDWLSVGMNMSFSRSQNDRISNDNQFSTPLQIVALSPITPIIDPRTGLPSGALDLETGAPNTNYPVYYNPLLSVDGSSYKTLVNRTLGNFYGLINFTKSLSFRSELGVDQLNQTEEAYYGTVTARNTGVPNGSGFYSSDQLLNVNTNNYFQFTKIFKENHSLDVVGGMSFQKTTSASSLADGEVFPSDSYKKLSSAASKVDATSGGSSNTLLSYFLRVNYKFRDKYLIALSDRYDGSSRFGVNERWGSFPAASVGWILSEEKFMQKIDWINFLKVKASYGSNGNEGIPDFASRGLYSGDGAYGGAAGQKPSQIANPDLKWESTSGMDLGLVANFFNSRIGIDVDYYQRKTKDLLLNVEIPGTSGFATQFRNIGNLENKGVEFTINTVNIDSRNLKWTSTINFAANKNKVTNLGGQVLGSDVNKAKEGLPLGIFFSKEFAGADPNNGDALYYLNTVKEDGTLDRTTTNDYNAAQDVVIGDPNPDFIYGFGNTVTYKGIDFDVLLQGVSGNQIYNGGGQYMSASGSNGFDNQTTDQLGYWDKPGDVSMVPEPRMFYANGTNPSSRYISTGSYLRVKAVTLGYNLPSKFINRLKIEKARIYARAQNLFTITKYEGWDPEVNSDYQVSNINQAQDFYSAPQLKTIVFGINITL